MAKHNREEIEINMATLSPVLNNQRQNLKKRLEWIEEESRLNKVVNIK